MFTAIIFVFSTFTASPLLWQNSSRRERDRDKIMRGKEKEREREEARSMITKNFII